MMPGMNPRKMQQVMRRMGIQQLEIDAVEVIIKTKDSKIVFSNPSVSKVNMMGQETFQLIGEYNEIPLSSELEISEEDIDTVVQQTGADRKKAEQILKNNKGDIAKTIIDLSDD